MKSSTLIIDLRDLESARALAHAALDKWIETPRDPYYKNYSRKIYNPGIILELGGLTQPLINARLAFLSQKPNTVEVNGKNYLVSDIEKLKEVQ